MRLRDLLQAGPGAAALQDADVPEHAPRAAARVTRAAISPSWRSNAARNRLVYFPRASGFGTRLSNLHLAEVHLQPDLPRQDEQLPRDILAGQILARIGLVTHAVRVAHQHAERTLPGRTC